MPTCELNKFTDVAQKKKKMSILSLLFICSKQWINFFNLIFISLVVFEITKPNLDTYHLF